MTPPWINHLWIVSPFLVAKARKRLDIPLRFGHFSSCRLHLVFFKTTLQVDEESLGGMDGPLSPVKEVDHVCACVCVCL
jgi:hypothetical protein